MKNIEHNSNIDTDGWGEANNISITIPELVQTLSRNPL